MPKFVYRVPVEEALTWNLYKTTLNYELTDRAEAEGIEKLGSWFEEQEVDTQILTEDGKFIVTFVWEGSPNRRVADLTVVDATPEPTLEVTFHPQAWVGDEAVDVDPEGPTTFRVPLKHLEEFYHPQRVYELEPYRELPQVPAWIREWRGPFRFEVDESEIVVLTLVGDGAYERHPWNIENPHLIDPSDPDDHWYAHDVNSGEGGLLGPFDSLMEVRRYLARLEGVGAWSSQVAGILREQGHVELADEVINMSAEQAMTYRDSVEDPVEAADFHVREAAGRVKGVTDGSGLEVDENLSFTELVRAADSRSQLDLMDAVDEDQECTYLDAGDNVREAILLQVEEAFGSRKKAVERLLRLSLEAWRAARGIGAGRPVGGALYGVVAHQDGFSSSIGLFESRDAAMVGALEDLRVELGDDLPEEVAVAWSEGRLGDALDAWDEAQEYMEDRMFYEIHEF